jgi:hypothetical protein
MFKAAIVDFRPPPGNPQKNSISSFPEGYFGGLFDVPLPTLQGMLSAVVGHSAGALGWSDGGPQL